jgi:hypothetical protein
VSFRRARRVIDMTYAETTAALEAEATELADIRDQARERSQFYALAASATGPQTADQYRAQAAEDAAFWAQLDQLTRAAQSEVARRKKAAKK